MNRQKTQDEKNRLAEWLDGFNERQQKEIAFSRFYHIEFGHGTGGHLGYSVVAMLAEELDQRAFMPNLINRLACIIIDNERTENVIDEANEAARRVADYL